MTQEYLISKTKLDELEKELDYLKSVKRQEMAAVIKEALSHGDLSENSEYDEAKNAQAIMEARIVELEKMLQNSKVIDEESISTDHISIGCKVEVCFVEDDVDQRSHIGHVDLPIFVYVGYSDDETFTSIAQDMIHEEGHIGDVHLPVVVDIA